MKTKTDRTKQRQSAADDTATVLTHVRELQIRLLITASVLVGAGVVAYVYYGQILDILRAPLNAPLYYNSVSGSFAFVMKICMVAGIAVSVPLIVYNLIMFVRPAFPEIFNRRRVTFMTAGSIAAAAIGAVFGFVFIIPGALHFFSGFQVHGLHELISADSYLNFVVNVLITFVLIFQLPIIASVIDRIKPISPRALWKGEKWALLISVIISVIVPFAMDFMTQALIAAPIFVLYNLSFVVIVIQHAVVKRAKARKAARAARAYRPKAVPAHGVPPVPRMAMAAPIVTQPHPQLAEVLAQTTQAPRAVHSKAPAPAVVAAPTIARPAPVRRVVSMDGMSRVGVNRAQPAQIIRSAGQLQPPMRPQPQRRPGRLMADIR